MAQTLTLAELNLKATANGAGIGGSVAGTLAGDVDIALEQLSAHNLRLTEARRPVGAENRADGNGTTLSVAGNAVTADALNLKLAGLETSQGVSGDAEVTAGVSLN